MYIGGITEIQVHMRKLLLTFSLIAGIILLLQGQSAALQNQIAADKNALSGDFYELLDGGDGKTNLDWVLQFDHHNFESGYYYYILVYFEDCSKCEVGMYFHNKVTDEVQYLEPNVERADGFVRGTYHIHQTIEAHGDLAVYAKSKKDIYTYAMLYRRWDFSME